MLGVELYCKKIYIYTVQVYETELMFPLVMGKFHNLEFIPFSIP